MRLSYGERSNKHVNEISSRLLKLMETKKTNLCVSVDARNTKDFLEIIEKVAPYVCVIKTHIDIIDDFNYEKTILPLVKLSKEFNFLIFEDRKFADIGSTVKAQYSGGVYKISSWAHITNAHTVPGPGIVDGLKDVAFNNTYHSDDVNKNGHDLNEDRHRGLILLAEMSSKGALTTKDYAEKTVEIARNNRDFVFGFIAQSKVGLSDEDWIILTPGVGLDDKGDNLGQQYRTVNDVISTGSDIIIVGRGIYANGRDPQHEAKRYRNAGWQAYLDSLNSV